MNKTLCQIAAVLATTSFSTQAVLIHRYSFNDAVGDATGATLTDSVGSAHGVVRGAGAVFTGSGLDLPGGGSGTAAYGDLPNNLVSVHSSVTFEGWVTIDGGGNPWARIFDFGSTNPGGLNGEVTGPGNTNGAGTDGLDYIFLSASRGGDYNAQRVEIRNEDPAGGGITTHDSNVATAFPQPIHFAVTWVDTGVGTSEINYWRDGVQLTTNGAVTSNLGDLNDVNNWLGRSTWLNDGNLNATFDEFRIYDNALTGAEVAASMTAGPNAVSSTEDTDNDGIPNTYEDRYAFLDPANPNDAALDEDGDNLSNLEEFNASTKPDVADTDSDGLNDGDEINTHGTNPLVADTDRDGLSDGAEVNTHSTLPLDPDSDNDLIPDGYEVGFAFLSPTDPNDAALDEDGDDLSNLEEFNASTQPDVADTDGDGLNDGPELNTHNTNPLLADSDQDGLSDGDELAAMTDPLVVDTDGDGLNDGPEVTEGLNPLVADATRPGMIHRYSFNPPAGPANPGATVTDSIGGADGVVVGANGQWTGSAITLPGGAGATADAAYVDLPNRLMSSLDHLSFEAWFTIHSQQNWSRIWDFGSTLQGEVTTGISGNLQGQDYFIFAPNRGTDINVQRTTIRNLDPAAPGGGTGPVDDQEEPLDTSLSTTLGQEYHVASVWTSDGNGGGQLVLFRDGAYVSSRSTTFTPRDINDVNNWLGRSNWTGDAYLNGDLNEFRIYEGSMNEAAVAASFAAGSDAAIDKSGPRITEFSHATGTDELFLKWESKAGKIYDVLSSTDLSVDPSTWPIVAGLEGIAATPPINSVMFVRPVDDSHFYVVQERNAPPLFLDDFESDQGWVSGANAGDPGNTVWERGAPSNFGPFTAAGGSANCFGTNLSDEYGSDDDIYLRSPAIDLTDPGLTGVRLTMQHFLDTELAPSNDVGAIRVLDANDLNIELGSVASGLEGFFTDWREFSAPLPAAALGNIVILEFRFTSDNFPDTVFGGWYLDDVTLEAE